MALNAGFLIGGDTNETPQSLARKRALIAQIMANGRAPTNIGEGLSALGDGIVANVLGRRADAAEKAGQASANEAFAPIAAMFSGGGFSGNTTSSTSTPRPSSAPTPVGQPPIPGIQSTGGDMEAYRNAIASIESAGSGDYGAIGPTHPKLGRALGRYQIMEANVGPWSREVLGREVTPEEFMANPQLQDQIFDAKFGSYVKQFGPEGAAQAWIGGPGGVGKTNRKDSLGTSIGAYGQKFTNAIGGAPSTAAEAVTAMGQGGMEPMAYVDPMVSAPNSQQPPAMAPQQGPSRNGLPFDLVSGSPQLARADTRRGILRALTGQTGPEPGATGAFPAVPVSSPMAAPQPTPAPSVASPAPTQTAAPAASPQPQISTQQLIAAINNPWLSDSQRAIAQSLLEQQMQANDPLRQLQIQKLRKEVEGSGAGEVKIAGDRAFLIKPDGSVTDVTPSLDGQKTNGFRFTGSSVEAQALNGLIDSGQITPEQAQQLGAGKTITGPNGEIIFMTPQGVFGQPAQGGSPQPITQDQPSPAPAPRTNIPITEPKVTLDEKKAMTFADRMVTSGDIIDKFGAAGTDKAEVMKSQIPFGIGNMIVGEDFQKFDQARRDFINAQLRRESGAVISDQEFDNANKQYFPQPGDTPEVLMQKAENRRIAIEGMIRDGGPTYKPPKAKRSETDLNKPISEMTDEELEAIANGD